MNKFIIELSCGILMLLGQALMAEEEDRANANSARRVQFVLPTVPPSSDMLPCRDHTCYYPVNFNNAQDLQSDAAVRLFFFLIAQNVVLIAPSSPMVVSSSAITLNAEISSTIQDFIYVPGEEALDACAGMDARHDCPGAPVTATKVITDLFSNTISASSSASSPKGQRMQENIRKNKEQRRRMCRMRGKIHPPQFDNTAKKIDSFNVLGSAPHYDAPFSTSNPNAAPSAPSALPVNVSEITDFPLRVPNELYTRYQFVYERDSTPAAAPGFSPNPDWLKLLREPRSETPQSTPGNYGISEMLLSNKPPVLPRLHELCVSNDNVDPLTRDLNLTLLHQNEDDLTKTLSTTQREILLLPRKFRRICNKIFTKFTHKINIAFSTSLFTDYGDGNVLLQSPVMDQIYLLKRVHTILPSRNVVIILQNSYAVSPRDQIFLNNLIRYSQGIDLNTSVSLIQFADTLFSHRVIVPAPTENFATTPLESIQL